MALVAVCAAVAPTKLEITNTHVPEVCDRKTAKGDKIAVHYTGRLFDGGKVFDSSVKRGTPFEFQLGGGQVIRGWDEGLLDMCVGEKRVLTIPPAMAYGAQGAGGLIPPNAALVFEVEMVSFKSKPKTK
eukprot:a676490_1298.p2 GENE.a676490_1298~~a676490_1298.p2  ORF type:complete len:150 (+),score=70.93 a676490_1298:65-451(+)